MCDVMRSRNVNCSGRKRSGSVAAPIFYLRMVRSSPPRCRPGTACWNLTACSWLDIVVARRTSPETSQHSARRWLVGTRLRFVACSSPRCPALAIGSRCLAEFLLMLQDILPDLARGRSGIDRSRQRRRSEGILEAGRRSPHDAQEGRPIGSGRRFAPSAAIV